MSSESTRYRREWLTTEFALHILDLWYLFVQRSFLILRRRLYQLEIGFQFKVKNFMKIKRTFKTKIKEKGRFKLYVHSYVCIVLTSILACPSSGILHWSNSQQWHSFGFHCAQWARKSWSPNFEPLHKVSN